MSHFDDLAAHELEHVLQDLWTLHEEGRGSLADLRATSRVERIDDVVERLDQAGLIRRSGERIEWTEPGRERAQQQIRRHRLAEFLLANVLDVRDDRVVNHTACVMEHVLSAEVTDSVCSFLGHPKSCPHGKPIPAGPCCRSFSTELEPLVQPLDRLPAGQAARVVYIVSAEPQLLSKLSGLGLCPGATIRLQQRRPAAVVALGETTLALDPEIASRIFVKRL